MSRYAVDFLPEGKNLVIGLSVSGEVSRTLEAIRRARRAGATTIGLTGTTGSRIAQAGDKTLLMLTPPFDFAPGVRGYIATLLMLYAASVRMGQARSKITPAQAADLRREIGALADAVECTIAWDDAVAHRLAQDWRDANEFVFAGAGPNYGTALFSAAKILEASGDAAIGQDLEEWAHLQYFARAVNTPTLIISANGHAASRDAEIATAARAIGRRVAAIVPEGEEAVASHADIVLRFAKTREAFSPFVACIPGMLLAAYRAEVIGEPFFRAFGGGRDVEGGGGISRIRTSEMVE
jgi:glucosamine--fructose-6-phosphate aminotransferase (isomerizing)